MGEAEPPIIKNAGDVVFPDVDVPLPIKLVAMAAMAWIFLVPVLVGVAARRGNVRRAVAVYAVGVLIAALFFTEQSGLMGEPFARRLSVWARHIWVPLLGVTLVLSITAACFGRASRWLWALRDVTDDLKTPEELDAFIAAAAETGDVVYQADCEQVAARARKRWGIKLEP